MKQLKAQSSPWLLRNSNLDNSGYLLYNIRTGLRTEEEHVINSPHARTIYHMFSREKKILPSCENKYREEKDVWDAYSQEPLR